MMFMKSKKLWITVIILLVIGTVGVFGMDYLAKSSFANKTPFEKLIYSSVKNMKYRSYDSTQNVNMDYAIGDYKIKADMNFDVKKSGDKNYFGIMAKLNDKEVNLGSIYFDAQKIILDLTGFYDKPLYVYYDEIGKLLKTAGMTGEESNLHTKDYMDIFMNFKNNANLKKVKADTYIDMVKKYFEDAIMYIGDESITIQDVKYDTEKYKLDLQNENVILAIVDTLEAAKQDQNLKLASKDLATNLLNKALQNEDYKEFGLAKEEMEGLIQTISNEFDSYWNQLLDAMINTYKTAAEADLSGMDMELFYHLTKTGDMVKSYGSQKVDKEGIKTQMTFDSEIFHINKSVSIPKYDLKNAMNLAVESMESLQDVFGKIAQAYGAKFTEIFLGDLQ